MSELPKLKLYTNKICPFAVRAHLALRLRGIPYEIEQVSIPTPASFKEINPMGKLPTLEVHMPGSDKAVILYESVAIANFVEDIKASGPSLMPACSVQRAYMRMFIELCGDFVMALYKLLRASKATTEELEALKNELENRTMILESFIGKHGAPSGPFIFGESPSLADTHIVPFLDRMTAFFPHFRPYEPMTQAPRLKAILHAFSSNAEYKDIFLGKDEYVTLYAKYANPE